MFASTKACGGPGSGVFTTGDGFARLGIVARQLENGAGSRKKKKN